MHLQDLQNFSKGPANMREVTMGLHRDLCGVSLEMKISPSTLLRAMSRFEWLACFRRQMRANTDGSRNPFPNPVDPVNPV
jgi:hypothetical protein